ncbi:MAG: hypothetical protein KF862_07165 [Chitinophagaceae bacterium]|nr:hypothetical protein [Chitinophagaceae bacterium]
MEQIIIDFKRNVLGEVSVGTYAAAFFFSLLVIIVNLIVVSRLKYKDATGTPDKWSFRFAIIDNSLRILASMILMFLFYRFASTIIAKELSMEWAVGVGTALTFGLDKVFGELKSRFSFFDIKKRDD